jgi:hypothetical protein
MPKCCFCSLWRYTFVQNLDKGTTMVTEIFLTREQLEELIIQVLGRKSKEMIVGRCIDKGICKRATAYKALDVARYEGENYTHRSVTNEAVEFLKERFGVTFPWAKIEADPITA